MISIKTKYALAVVFELAKNKNTLMTIKQLASNCNVPKKYLEQILNALRKADIVKSNRGSQGGYQLAKSAELITLLDIAKALEQSLSLAQGYTGGGVLSQCWKDIDLIIKSSFNVTLASLIKKDNESKQCLSFAI